MGKLNRMKWCLIGCLIVGLLLAVGSVFVPGKLTDAIKWVSNNDSASRLRTPPEQKTERGDRLVEMVVETIGVSQIDYQPVVILKEKGGELYLPIWIGLLEANAISVILEGTEVPRPLTADLLCSIIDETEASLDYIVINDLQEHTFYANIALKANWRQIQIDARPSDAIAIALRVKAPIYAEKAVLEKAGIRPGQETDKYTIMRVDKGKPVSLY